MTDEQLSSDELRTPHLASLYGVTERLAERMVRAAAGDPTTRHATGRLLSDHDYGQRVLDGIGAHLTSTGELDELVGPEPDQRADPDAHLAWRRLRYRLQTARQLAR